MKLSPQQNKVIWCLQNGYVLITSSESKRIWCGNDKGQFSFSGTVFGNLYEKRLIAQESEWPFNYELTKAGIEIKTTKPINL